jgi:hypothetical protein
VTGFALLEAAVYHLLMAKTSKRSVQVFYEGMRIQTDDPVRIVPIEEARRLKESGEGYFSSNGKVLILVHVPVEVIAARFK